MRALHVRARASLVSLRVLQVDHFAYANQDKYDQRYLINTDNWTPGGPIFFYTGNEGAIELFCDNTVRFCGYVNVMLRSVRTMHSALCTDIYRGLCGR